MPALLHDEGCFCWNAGHVVAVRVTSEDANDGFKPTCGAIEELSFRPSPDVWGYFSVKSGGGIHEYSDSQVCSLQPEALPLSSCTSYTTCNPVLSMLLSLLIEGLLAMTCRTKTVGHLACCQHSVVLNESEM